MKYKLSEICEFISVKIDLEANVTLSNYISTENMLINRQGVSVSEKLPSTKRVNSYQKKDILISNIRPYFKKIWLSDKQGGCSADVLVLRANELVIPEFLYCLLFTDNFFNYMTATAKGTKMPRGDRQAIRDYEVEVPNMEKQVLIANFLSTIEKKIQLNKKMNKNLFEQGQLLYKKIKKENKLDNLKLKDIANIVMGQSPKSDTYNSSYVGLPLLNGAADFRGGINPSKWTSDPKRVVEGGEYIFGVRATVGLTTKVFSKYAIGRGTGSAKAKKDIYEEYLFYVLKDLFEYYSHTGTGSVYVNISKNDFDYYEFEIPNDEVIKEFHNRINPMFELIYKNQKEIETLSNIRDTVLPKLLSGEIQL